MNSRPYFKSVQFGVNLLHPEFILRLFSLACVFCVVVTSMRAGIGSTLLATPFQNQQSIWQIKGLQPEVEEGKRSKLAVCGSRAGVNMLQLKFDHFLVLKQPRVGFFVPPRPCKGEGEKKLPQQQPVLLSTKQIFPFAGISLEQLLGLMKYFASHKVYPFSYQENFILPLHSGAFVYE